MYLSFNSLRRDASPWRRSGREGDSTQQVDVIAATAANQRQCADDLASRLRWNWDIIFFNLFKRMHLCRTIRLRLGLGLLLLVSGGARLFATGGPAYQHPEFMIENWQASEGVAENSALAVAQTPDGYLWVGGSSGLLRFNGHEFERAALLTGVRELGSSVLCLNTDRSGRLWVCTYAGLAVLEKGEWHLVAEAGASLRTIAENIDGRILAGTTDGRVVAIQEGVAKPAKAPAGLSPSGVFLVPDAQDGVLWLANRSFVGRLVGDEWRAVGPQPAAPDAQIAGAARGGGLWVFCAGTVEVLSSRWPDGDLFCSRSQRTSRDMRRPLRPRLDRLHEPWGGWGSARD